MNWDTVIIGAGTAGCVLAHRLSADPARRVLLIESGEDSRAWALRVPAAMIRLMNDRRFTRQFESDPEPALHGRRLPIPRGRVVGGSSAVNGMLHVRGQVADYDEWARLGNDGWAHADVLPAFRRSEAFERPGADPAWRGTTGPLPVADPRHHHPVPDRFIAAAVAEGFPRNADYNGRQQDGFGYFQVNQRHGRRMSAADSYLTPARHRRNLTVMTGAEALQLDLSSGRCRGVRIRRRGAEAVIQAGETILSAGAIQSPQLLELSGIGDPNRLRALGVDIVQPLPGVGEGLRDHFAVRLDWRLRKVRTLNEQTRGLSLAAEALRYVLSGRGVLSWTAGIAHGFVRTLPDLDRPDVQFHFAHASYRNAVRRELDNQPGMTVSAYVMRPESLGSVHCRSRDPLAAPAIRVNVLDTEYDRQTLVRGMKVARRIVANPVFDDIRVTETTPGSDHDDDEALLEHARRNGQTVYHPVGTCRMGRDPLAVVDPRLKVHGVDGLRVVDASVMPTMVSGNVNSAVVMIAERASELVLNP